MHRNGGAVLNPTWSLQRAINQTQMCAIFRSQIGEAAYFPHPSINIIFLMILQTGPLFGVISRRQSACRKTDEAYLSLKDSVATGPPSASAPKSALHPASVLRPA